jgi:hypothetical protein
METNDFLVVVVVAVVDVVYTWQIRFDSRKNQIK